MLFNFLNLSSGKVMTFSKFLISVLALSGQKFPRDKKFAVRFANFLDQYW